jgi:hypothetical protein
MDRDVQARARAVPIRQSGPRLDYFWTAVTPGRARSHAEDGTIVEAVYAAGETRHFIYGKGEYKIHDLKNVGDQDLWFTTVEFLDSANAPLELGANNM